MGSVTEVTLQTDDATVSMNIPGSDSYGEDAWGDPADFSYLESAIVRRSSLYDKAFINRPKRHVQPYKALPAGRCIRLLTLNRGKLSEPLVGSLSVVDLGSSLAYDAVSYVWGEPGSKGTILLDNHKMPLQDNLHSFLLQFRRPDVSQVLWIDALCIDQQHLGEKGHQVALMGEIYKSAHSVLIWLGLYRSSVSTDPKNGFTQQNSRPYGSQWIDMIQRDYWLRAWIVQEVILAKKLTILYGEFRFPWSDRTIDNLRSVETRENEMVTFLDLRRRRRQLGFDDNLEHLFINSLRSRCHDPRDKIYSLLALAKDYQQNPVFAVDYQKDKLILFYEVLCFIKPHERALVNRAAQLIEALKIDLHDYQPKAIEPAPELTTQLQAIYNRSHDTQWAADRPEFLTVNAEYRGRIIAIGDWLLDMLRDQQVPEPVYRSKYKVHLEKDIWTILLRVSHNEYANDVVTGRRATVEECKSMMEKENSLIPVLVVWENESERRDEIALVDRKVQSLCRIIRFVNHKGLFVVDIKPYITEPQSIQYATEFRILSSLYTISTHQMPWYSPRVVHARLSPATVAKIAGGHTFESFDEVPTTVINHVAEKSETLVERPEERLPSSEHDSMAEVETASRVDHRKSFFKGKDLSRRLLKPWIRRNQAG